jgi:hypothetical protein
MSLWRRNPFGLRYLGAAVYPGDHGIRPDGDDPRRTGLLEFTDHLRWVPEKGEGWRVPIRLIEVESPAPSWRARNPGLVLALPDGETINVYGRTDGGLLGSMTQTGGVFRPQLTAQIRNELLARGAADASRPRRTELGDVS